MAEKREKQMKDMGIDEKDISDVPVLKKNQEKTTNGQISLNPSTGQATNCNSAGGKKEEKKRILLICITFYLELSHTALATK